MYAIINSGKTSRNDVNTWECGSWKRFVNNSVKRFNSGGLLKKEKQNYFK